MMSDTIQKKVFYYLFTLLMVAFFIQSCANTQGQLGGGPRDEDPPVVDTSNSTRNYATFFTERKISVSFDEFLRAQGLLAKTIISPPLTYIPKIETRGKKLTIELNENEVLKKDATYIFNFGDAIIDFREGNKLENYRFVFSTGAVIDSLGMSGSVYDAFTGKPMPEVYVMLYDNIQDSVVYEEKPFYFTISDKEGKFEFQNLRSDTFKVFAVKDLNLNYLYDPPSEPIGFLDSLIVLKDSILSEVSMEIFQEGSTNRFLKIADTRNGKIKLVFTSVLREKPIYEILYPDFKLPSKIEKDSFIIDYDQDLDSLILVIDKVDTITVRDLIVDSIFLNSFLQAETNATRNKIIPPNDSIRYTFNYPLKTINSKLISIVDSLNTYPAEWTLKNNTIIGNAPSLATDSVYDVIILPGAVTDVYQRSNDTLRQTIKIGNKEKYGDIELTITNLTSTYFYQFTLRKEGRVIREKTVTDVDSVLVSFNTLEPATYELNILEDRNNNKRWDPGSYSGRYYSEKNRKVSLEKLRENWKLEDNIDWISLNRKD